uniref:Uncharacterized protein n=1 Tax=Arundo donax TaxID=35708 RepID=A0A0A9D013_ARUDO
MAALLLHFPLILLASNSILMHEGLTVQRKLCIIASLVSNMYGLGGCLIVKC